MMGLLRNIRVDREISILLVEQNAKAALKIADYAYVLKGGKCLFREPGRR